MTTVDPDIANKPAVHPVHQTANNTNPLPYYIPNGSWPAECRKLLCLATCNGEAAAGMLFPVAGPLGQEGHGEGPEKDYKDGKVVGAHLGKIHCGL